MEDRVRILETQLGLAHPQVACTALPDLLDWTALGSCNAVDELMAAADCPGHAVLLLQAMIECCLCLSGRQGMAGTQPGVPGTAEQPGLHHQGREGTRQVSLLPSTRPLSCRGLIASSADNPL